MQLTDPEVSILKALASLPADKEDCVSVDALAREKRNLPVRQIHEILETLRGKTLVKLDEEENAACIAEAGVAALASV